MKTRIVCVLAMVLTLVQVARADWWANRFGQIEVVMRQAVYDAVLTQQLAANPNDSWSARFQAHYWQGQEADQRLNAAIGELCNHDTAFCADVFQRYGLRWISN